MFLGDDQQAQRELHSVKGIALDNHRSVMGQLQKIHEQYHDLSGGFAFLQLIPKFGLAPVSQVLPEAVSRKGKDVQLTPRDHFSPEEVSLAKGVWDSPKLCSILTHDHGFS